MSVFSLHATPERDAPWSGRPAFMNLNVANRPDGGACHGATAI